MCITRIELAKNTYLCNDTSLHTNYNYFSKLSTSFQIAIVKQTVPVKPSTAH